MSSRSANRLFLFLIAVLLFSDLVLGLGGTFTSQLKYLVGAAAGILLLRSERTPVREALPYDRGLKLSTMLLIAALVFCSLPLTEFLSAFGAICFGNIMDLVTEDELYGSSLWEALLETAVMPAVFEEMFFRGFFYSGFRKARGARTAVLFSALLFGIFHMNFQQAIYAFVLGLILAVLRELTGSMWAGTLFHFINNGFAVILYYTGENQVSETETAGISLGPLVLPALISAALSVCVLLLIAGKEGRLQELKASLSGRTERVRDENREKIITAPLIIGMLICIGAMLVLFVAQRSNVMAGIVTMESSVLTMTI